MQRFSEWLTMPHDSNPYAAVSTAVIITVVNISAQDYEQLWKYCRVRSLPEEDGVLSACRSVPWHLYTRMRANVEIGIKPTHLIPS